MKPNLKLVINIKKEIGSAQGFIKYSDYVDRFLPLNFQYILNKKFTPVERNKMVAEYTKHIHNLYKKEIREGVAETKKRWAKIENKFYRLIDKIFQGHPWPKGKYTGYASIYHMYPRYIKEKTFFFPYKQNKLDPRLTIAHEMLHFIFFDYIKNKYGIEERDKIKSKEPKYVWKISETFNVVIENWQPYMKLFGRKEKRTPYHQGYKKMFSKMTKQWTKEQNINKLLNNYFKI
mgnify:FL=1